MVDRVLIVAAASGLLSVYFRWKYSDSLNSVALRAKEVSISDLNSNKLSGKTVCVRGVVWPQKGLTLQDHHCAAARVKTTVYVQTDQQCTADKKSATYPETHSNDVVDITVAENVAETKSVISTEVLPDHSPSIQLYLQPFRLREEAPDGLFTGKSVFVMQPYEAEQEILVDSLRLLPLERDYSSNLLMNTVKLLSGQNSNRYVQFVEKETSVLEMGTPAYVVGDVSYQPLTVEGRKLMVPILGKTATTPLIISTRNPRELLRARARTGTALLGTLSAAVSLGCLLYYCGRLVLMYRREKEWRRQWREARRKAMKAEALRALKEKEKRKYDPSSPTPPEGAAPPDDSSSICVVCMERPRNIVFATCGHLCVCSECSELLQYRTCPLCRTRSSQLIKVFL